MLSKSYFDCLETQKKEKNVYINLNYFVEKIQKQTFHRV